MNTTEPGSQEFALARYKAIFDRSPIAIEYYDEDGRLEVANNACLEMFGIVHPAQIAKFRLFDDPNISDDMKDRLKKGETVRSIYEFNFDLVRKHNLYETTREGICRLDVMIAPLTIGERPAGYVAQIQNVTEQYKTERALEESEKKYRMIAESIHDVFWMATSGFDRMIYVSPAYERLWGRTCESLYETPFSFVDAIRSEDRQHVLDEFAFHRSNLTPWVITYRVIRPDGTEIWVEDRGFPVLDANGSAYLFTGTVSDVTERKEMEMTLTAREDYLRTILETVVDGFLIVNAEGRITGVNAAYSRMSGYTMEELRALGINDMDATENPEQTAERIGRIIKNGSEIFETRHRRKDGSQFDAEASVTYLGRDGGIFICFLRDISSRKLDEERIRSLLSEKEILLQEVHHRLKNNMVTIMSLLSLQSDTVKDPAALAMLEDTKSRIRSMAVLYEKLYRSMDFRAISAREYLPALIKEIIDNFPNRESVSVATDIEDITLDARVLSAVGIIINELITNAMKYAFDGRERGMIYVSFLTDGNKATLTVQDDGTGMPEDARHGFGMQLVEMLGEQLDGSICRERDTGTRFIVEFKHR